MLDPSVDLGKSIQSLRTAKETYDNLTEALNGVTSWLSRYAVMTHRAADLTRDAGKLDDLAQRKLEIGKLMESHQKALQTVLAFEDRLEKQYAQHAGRGRTDIDVDAARREILGRLSRLAE